MGTLTDYQTIASRLLTLQSQRASSVSTFIGTVKRGVPTGAGVLEARRHLDWLNQNPPDNNAPATATAVWLDAKQRAGELTAA